MTSQSKINAIYSCLRVCVALLAATALTGCTATSFLKEGEHFYDGAEIRFDTEGNRIGRKKMIESELQELITPQPNSKIFGMRPGVWFYYIAGDPAKKKGIRNFIRTKLGSQPVLLKDANPDVTATRLAGQLNNDGYFRSTATAEVKTRKKVGKVIYNITLKRPYRLDTIQYPAPKDSVYAPIFRQLSEASLLKHRQRYDLERMQAELARVETVLGDEGFYYFDDRYLIFEADSTVGQRRVNLRLKLEPGIPANARRIYRIGKVTVYPDYTITPDTLAPAADTLRVNNYSYVDSYYRFRPDIVTNAINIREGGVYRRNDHRLTISHLMGLGVFKFVNVKFNEVHRDSSVLNTDIFLTTLPKKSLRAEVQGVSKSNNFVGPGIELTFTNRNLLRGAELLQVKLRSAYEWQISRQNQGALNSLELGLESSLTIPRFISPVRINYDSRTYLPKTVFKAGLNVQNRVGYYRLNAANIGYGYIWRETADKSHELYLADVNYVRTDRRSAEFEQLINLNPVVKNSFENQFIIGTRYSYTYNSQLREDPLMPFTKSRIRTHNFYFNGNIDVAGNVIHAVQQVGRERTDSLQLFGSPYSQFVKGDIDLRHYWQLDRRNKIVSRLILGAGYAYGNSSTLPYIKQFAVGGANSIRAFQARSIGPGTYYIREEFPDPTLFVDQRGDLKLEGNVEFRFDIFKILKGALFADAGNVWTIRDDGRAGGQFDASTFLSQLAVGTGIGLRFDLSFLVLRLDTAFPLRKPWLDAPWVIRDIDFGSKTWRSENLIFNIAIGYPF